MPNYSKTIIAGHLGDDPKIHHFDDGGAVCNISVATTDKWKDKQTGQEKSVTEWHRCTFHGSRAGVVAEYFRKGDPILVEGKNRTRKYQADDGSDRYTTEIICNRFEFLKGKQNRAQQQSQDLPPGYDDSPTNDDFDDDIPF